MFCSHLAPVWVPPGTCPVREGKKSFSRRKWRGHRSSTRPPSVSSPGALPGSLILARPRGRSGAAAPGPPRPLPSGPQSSPAPPGSFPLPAPCPASPFPRPGPAPDGQKGTAAGQERRDAGWNAAPEPDQVVGGGGGDRRLAGAKMLSCSVLGTGHNNCSIPLSGDKTHLEQTHL